VNAYNPSGDPVEGKFCPKCKVGQIVYNGNYFCERIGNGCDWAMSERNSAYNDEIIKTYLLQRRARAVAEGDDWNVKHMDHYLAQYSEKDGV